jgi:AraC-like DNA-binding protein
VDDPDIRQPALWRAVHDLHRALGEPDDALEAEARLATVAERLRAHLGDQAPEPAGRHPASLAGDLRELLDAQLFEATTLAEAGHALGASPAHLVRSFTRTLGIAPHQYLVARQFKRHVGTPPGRYALSTRGGAEPGEVTWSRRRGGCRRSR